jgi:hypothetical protein
VGKTSDRRRRGRAADEQPAPKSEQDARPVTCRSCIDSRPFVHHGRYDPIRTARSERISSACSIRRPVCRT